MDFDCFGKTTKIELKKRSGDEFTISMTLGQECLKIVTSPQRIKRLQSEIYINEFNLSTIQGISVSEVKKFMK